MKLGLLYEICRPEPFDGFLSEEEAYWQAAEQIVRAEEIGFEYVWAVEHHFLGVGSDAAARSRARRPIASHFQSVANATLNAGTLCTLASSFTSRFVW